ncbi:uncharacterized protein TA10910 [Theileria annulata]|uniref:Uncharacterized protein n=1 Tax=Theileria annulata TaxID=5874 RepID=Q4U976_THEAN|nr:uncharacterized protein TA10910 [Theileria annulata]CAI76627.1 hypothetical protein, conserved [Theileria annulata]|eukprot:XP_953252.1 hypothetical protein, conserved [Theileria annulata]
MVKNSLKSSFGEDSKQASGKKTKKTISKECKISNVIKSLSEQIVKRSADLSHGRWVDLDAKRPSPRAHSTLTLIEEGLCVMFGGEFFDGSNVILYNDTFLYNLSTNKWKVLDTPAVPLPRCSHQATFYKNRIYIFGGEFNTLDEFHHFNDIHYLCLSTLRWTKLDVTGQIPSSRSGHRMVLWKNYWVLFGGFHDNGNESTYYNDLYYFDLENNCWHQVNQHLFTSSLPEPRAGCVLLALNDGKHLMMHGGFSKKDSSNDVVGSSYKDSWLIDMNLLLSNSGNVLVWSKVKGCEPEFSTGLSFATSSEYAVLFGGVNDEYKGLHVKSTFSNKCFKLNLNQRKYNPTEIGFERENKDDNLGISKLSLSKSFPTPRMNSNAVIYNDTLYIFGGIVEVKDMEITESDCWALDLKTNEWKCIDEGFEKQGLYNNQIESDESDDEFDEDSGDETEEMYESDEGDYDEETEEEL